MLLTTSIYRLVTQLGPSPEGGCLRHPKASYTNMWEGGLKDCHSVANGMKLHSLRPAPLSFSGPTVQENQFPLNNLLKLHLPEQVYVTQEEVQQRTVRLLLQ